MTQRKGRIIGLTGNIASGKTSVAQLLREIGLPVIDADQIAREVVEPGQPALGAIANEFGPEVMTASGTLDRTALRKIAFANEEKRKRLEAILHPAIARRSSQVFEEHFKRGASHILYEASLLFEAERAQEFDDILMITCDPTIQKTRVMARDPSISAELADQMISSQMPQAEKVRRSTWVIENNATPDELRRRVAHWYQNNIKK